MELGPVTRITADAVGEPGMRAFYLQAVTADETVTVAVEKQQVQLLSASILELLADLQLETGQGPGEDAMGLVEPVEPRWRAGKLSIGYDQDEGLFVLEIEELQPELDEDDRHAPSWPNPSRSRCSRPENRCSRCLGTVRPSPNEVGPPVSTAATPWTRKVTRVPR